MKSFLASLRRVDRQLSNVQVMKNKTERCTHGQPHQVLKSIGLTGIILGSVSLWLFPASVIAAPPVIPAPSPALPVRSIVNPSFEVPKPGISGYPAFSEYTNAAGNGQGVFYNDTDVPGWNTTAPSYHDNYYNWDYTSPIEFWRKVTGASTNNFPSADNGTQYIELNAATTAAVYQDLCLIQGETVTYSARHRARGTSTTDTSTTNTMRIFISDPTTWTGKTYTSTPIYTSGSVSALPNAWKTQSGSWTNSIGTQKYRFAFEALTGTNGDPGVGNFLDNIQIQLAPTVEFAPTDTTNKVNLTTHAEDNIYYATIRLNGNMQTAGTVDISLGAGSTIDQNDYTVGTPVSGTTGAVLSGVTATKNATNGKITVNIPAGIYDINSPGDYITIPLNFADTVIEPTEVANFTLSNLTGGGSGGSGNLILGSGACNPLSTLSVSVADNDVDLGITNTDGKTTAAPGSAVSYTVTVTNNAGTGGVGQTLNSINVADTLPADLQGVTFTPSTGSYNSSTGAWTGLTLAPGQSITLTVAGTVKSTATVGSSLVNTATVSLPTGSTLTDINAANNTATDTDTIALPSLSGTVFEDPNYGGGAGRPFATAGTSGRDGARVELYSSTGVYITNTTTSGGGNYTFAVAAPGDYQIRVVNSTVTSGRPGSISTLTPVQTFRTDASVTAGTVTAVTDHVGGEKPTEIDAPINTTATLATLNAVANQEVQSLTAVKVGSSAVSGIDFGYNFDTIVNTNNSGQGSLRQFINNSNALTNTGLAQVGQTAGKEVSIFMIPDGNAHSGLQAGLTSQLTGGVAIIQPTSALPAITDTDTTINGATQTSNIGNSNSGSYGFVGAVGTGLDGRENTGDEPSLNGINKPEVAIKGINSIPIGLDLVGNNETVQNIAIYGFGQGTAPYQADVVARGTGITIDHNAIGTTADTLADPGAGVRSGGSHIYLATNSNSTIANNLIVFAYQRGIFSSEEKTLTVNIQGNEIRANNRQGDYAGGGIEFISFAGTFGGPSNGTISPQGSIVGNYIADNDPNQLGGKDNGIEFGGNTGATVLVKDNTISGNSSGISLYSLKYPVPHTNSITIQNNVLKNNYDSGVNISNNQGITITQNSIYNNIGLGIQLGAGANDGAYNTTSSSGSSANIPGNQAIDYPVITSSKLVAGTLTVKGFVGNVTTGSSTFGNTKLEFFIADNTLADQNGEVILGDGKSKPHGEGRTYIGNCNADANGMFTCSFANASTVGLTDPKNITATTTNGAGYTSQFSATPPAGAKLMLVKRITAINGVTTGFKTFVDNPDTTNDNNCNWPTAAGTAGACTNTYTVGAIDGGTVKPGDEIEYTIYYLNAGDSDATPARVCDALNPKLTFSPQGGNGIGLSQAGGAISALTNDATDSDKGKLTTPALATNCNFKDNNSSTQVVLVDVAPVSGAISGATPNTSYGFIRFKTTVK